MAKTKQRWTSREECMSAKYKAQKNLVSDRNEYFRRTGIPIYAEERRRWFLSVIKREPEPRPGDVGVLTTKSFQKLKKTQSPIEPPVKICSRRTATSSMRWFEDAGILVRTHSGGRDPDAHAALGVACSAREPCRNKDFCLSGLWNKKSALYQQFCAVLSPDNKKELDAAEHSKENLSTAHLNSHKKSPPNESPPLLKDSKKIDKMYKGVYYGTHSKL